MDNPANADADMSDSSLLSWLRERAGLLAAGVLFMAVAAVFLLPLVERMLEASDRLK